VVFIKRFSSFWRNTSGDAVVEATFLFPIIIFIFTALVLLSTYLPSRAILQRATQMAATAVAAEMSDTWLIYNETSLSYGRHTRRDQLDNVYASLFGRTGVDYRDKAEAAAKRAIADRIGTQFGTVEVSCNIINYVIYREVVVTATQSFPVGSVINLSIIGFPTEIEIVATSSAVVADGDGFIRNVDLAVDYADKIAGVFSNITDFISRFALGGD
jgi:Flp pilus assembly protein TadG